jgi:hypothetical protein
MKPRFISAVRCLLAIALIATAASAEEVRFPINGYMLYGCLMRPCALDQMQLESADIVRGRGLRRALQEGGKPFATMEVASL